MKTTYLKTILVMALCLAFSMEGRAVNVRLTTDKPRTVGVNNAERNLAQLLTAIDAAHRTRSNVSTRNIAMNDFAKKSLARIWAVTPFRNKGANLEAHLWMLRDGNMMVRDVPLLMLTDKSPTSASPSMHRLLASTSMKAAKKLLTGKTSTSSCSSWSVSVRLTT